MVGDNSTISGHRGRIWVDRENGRILRMEDDAVEIPAGFPITAAHSLIDYDWVKISDRDYLLPITAEIILTMRARDRIQQSRNEIRFRNYRKYSSDVRIIEDDVTDDDTPPKNNNPPKKP